MRLGEFAQPWGGALGAVETTAAFPGAVRLDAIGPMCANNVAAESNRDIGDRDWHAEGAVVQMLSELLVKADIPVLPIGKRLETTAGEAW